MKRVTQQDSLVGFIGLGRMGSNMAKVLLLKGYKLVVWSRTGSKVEEFMKLGAEAANSPSECAARADATICMLNTPQVTESVVLGLDEHAGRGVIEGLGSGKLLIDMSTNSLSTVRKLAEVVRSKGAEFIDAPVLGGPPLAAQGALTVLASGNRDAVEAARPLLESMSSRFWYVGDTGFGTIMKVIMNAYLFLLTGSLMEILALGAKLGIDPELALEVINNNQSRKTHISEVRAKNVIKGDFTPSLPIRLTLKDLELANELAAEASFPLPLTSSLRDLYAIANSMGLGEKDFSAIALVYERLTGAKLSKG